MNRAPHLALGFALLTACSQIGTEKGSKVCDDTEQSTSDLDTIDPILGFAPGDFAGAGVWHGQLQAEALILEIALQGPAVRAAWFPPSPTECPDRVMVPAALILEVDGQAHAGQGEIDIEAIDRGQLEAVVGDLELFGVFDGDVWTGTWGDDPWDAGLP